MYKRYTENEIKEIAEKVSERVLNEMAVPRKEYVEYAHHISYDIMEHLIKVCLFEDIAPYAVQHWRSEIFGFCKSVVLDRLKKGVDKGKAFDLGAVDMPFGEDFEELDVKMFSDMIYYYEHKEPKYRLHTTETPENAYNRSIGRILKFYSGFRDAAINNDMEMFSVVLDSFINNN